MGVSKLIPGQPLTVCLQADVVEGRAVRVAAAADTVATAVYVDADAKKGSCRAGLLVDATVKSHSAKGLALQALGLDAFAHFFHIPDLQGSAADITSRLKEAYPANSTVRARVIYADPKSTMNVSLLPLHVGLADAAMTATADVATQPAVGTTVADAVVRRVDGSAGALLDLGAAGLGFVVASRVPQPKKKSKKIQELLKLGSTHRARVVATNPMDAVVSVSLLEEDLNAPFLRPHVRCREYDGTSMFVCVCVFVCVWGGERR